MSLRGMSLRGMSLRVRLMIIGVAGVALALAVGGVVLYGVLAFAIDRALDNEAMASADQVVVLIDQHQLPDPIPVSGTQIVQVVDGRNRVLSSSVNADRLTALLRPDEVARASTGEHLIVPGSRAGVDGPLRAVAVAAGPAGDAATVVVASPVGDLTHGRELLRNLLLVTYPLLLAVLALIAWFVIGWTLRPVDALRTGADRISGTGHDERLPVPESADEIHALAVTLNGMLDRLAQARGRQRAFVADAAHELRSPLASIRTQLEVAKRVGEDGASTDDLLVDVVRLSALVEDLLLLARADSSGLPPPAREPFDVAPLLVEVALRHDDARVSVVVESAPQETVTVSANREDLRRVLANLLDNATRHAGSEVRLEATTEDGWVLVTVTDDGPGIPQADRERVFERFTRLDDARDRDAGGSGLGLAIVKELLRRVGGTIRLRDAVPATGATGPGLVVEVRLPGASGQPPTRLSLAGS